MKKIILLFAVLVSITINSLYAQITNGGFESWSGTNPDGWVGSKTATSGLTITKVTTDAHGGTNACGLTNTTTSHKRFTSVATSVTNGTEYTFSFWVKGSGQVRTGMYTGINGTTSGYVAYNAYVTVTSSWTQVSQTITADGTVSVAEFIISVGAFGDVVIDDVVVSGGITYNQANIIGFTIPEQLSNAVIDTSAKTVLLQVISGTSLTALVPTITTSVGATISPASGVAQNFTNSVVYIVTSEDGLTTKNWVATVAEASNQPIPIYDIQYTTDISGNSPLMNTVITTSGIVTAVQVTKGYYIQDGAGAWKGIYVYDSGHSPSIGDNITITATVSEYNGLTELINISSYSVNSSGNAISPTVISSNDAATKESYEGCFVKVQYANCTSANSNGTWKVNDGSGVLFVFKTLYDYTSSVVGTLYDVTGVITYYSVGLINELLPRQASDISVAVSNTEADIVSFSFAEQTSAALIDTTAKTVNIEVFTGTSLTALVPTITLSTGATISPLSGVAQDFTSAKIYTVTAQNTSITKTWTVTVTVATNTQSSQAEILTFDFPSDIQAESSVVNSYAGTITISVFPNVNKANLTPTITTSAFSTINPTSGIAQDFTNPKSYTVTAQDGTTKTWTVTVTNQTLTTIYDIQYTTATNGDSPLKNQIVTVTGIVTAVHNNLDYYIQDNSGAWNGINVIQDNSGFSIGDEIYVTGTVYENYNYTLIKNITSSKLISSFNNSSPTNVTIAQANNEDYEGVLITVDNAKCYRAPKYGEWALFDDMDSILVNDVIYPDADIVSVGSFYKVTGVQVYSYNMFRIYPRFDNDIVLKNIEQYTINISDNTVCPYTSVSFSVLGSNISSVYWNFGDGSTGSYNYISHYYSTIGDYPITAIVTDYNGSTYELTDTVFVGNYYTPINYASINVYNEPACPNSSLNFEAYGENITSYLWNFGDGTSSTSHYPNHAYTQVGTYPVSVKMTNYCGTDTILYYTVHIVDNLPFSGNLYLSISETIVCPNQSFNYSADAYGNSFVVNFGDGTLSTQSYGYHSYSVVGTYTISLTATDGCGNDSTITQTINVNSNTPVGYAYMDVNNEPTCPNTSISFQASGEDINLYLWNFGDGTSSTSHYPSHSYTQVGNYPVSVKLTNYCGNDTILYYTVHIVDDLPYSGYLSLYLSEYTVCPGQSFNFDAYVTENNYIINFGDGTTSTQTYGNHSYSSIGTYTVSLTATNNCGSDSTITQTIVVNNNIPISYAYFNVYSEPACPNTSINFQASGEDIESYLWNFGDGTSSTSHYPSHSYTQVGNYPVSVKLTNYCGNDTILYYTVHIVDNLPYSGNLYLSLSENTVCPTQSFSYYINTSESNFVVNFGDGNSSSQYSGNHSYSSAGTYTVSLIATNGCGNDSTISQTITVDDNIQIYNAYIYVETDPSCPNTIINFYGSGVGAISYLWDFGDGSSATSQYSTHSYSQTGTYPVSLKMTNYCGNDTVLYYTVHIENNIAYEGYIDLELYPFTFLGYGFSFDSVEVCPNQAVKYKGTAEGNITINFGDGTTSTQVEGNHTYSVLGTYIMTLTATNGCGNDSTVSVKVTVKDSVNFYDTYIYVSDSIVCPNTDIQFEAYVGDIPYSQAEILSMSISSYLWNFGDGTTSSDNNPEHSYLSSGNYSVSLKLTNYCGNDTTIYRSITIGGNLPYSDEIYLSLYENEVCPNQSFDYSVYTNGNDFIVDFGDGTTSTQSYSSHSYSNIGTYTITLTATNSCGNDTSVTRTIVVSNNVQVTTNYISVSSNSACPGDEVSFYVNDNYESYSWDFGDGVIGSGYSPVHQYDSLGYNFKITSSIIKKKYYEKEINNYI